MSVTVKDVEHIAALAKLEFNADEKEKFTHQLNQILSYMEKLNKLDTSNVEPLAQVIELQNAIRADIAQCSMTSDEAMANAPAKTDTFFKVPKVINE